MAEDNKDLLEGLDERGIALFEKLNSGEFTDEDLRELYAMGNTYEDRLKEFGPRTRDELHAFIKQEVGLDIPRVSVCEGHTSPFDALADLYFEETKDGEPVEAALIMANRGGSKTFLVALLHWLNSRFKKGCESATFGATEAQSLRAYAHLKNWVYDPDGNYRPEIVVSKMRETVWRNGSKVEVLPGTPQAVNGPHPQKAHADEIELMDDETWKESRNMTVSKRTPEGRLIKPQDIATSTRKGPDGRMQELINEIEEAINNGFKPPRKFYAWCIIETAAQVPNCQIARPELDEDEKCPCHTIAKGEIEYEDENGDTKTRTRLLSDECRGRFYKSRGWQPFGDVVKQFTENDADTFAVQQLCEKAEMSHHYLAGFAEEKHAIRDYMPDPDNGPIFLSVDWGGTNPHAVNWYQLLNFDVDVIDWLHNPRRLIEGTLVCFDEIYVAEIGNTALGNRVIDRENYWRQIFASRDQRWEVLERFADPQGKAARKDWLTECDPPLRTTWHTTREFDEHIKDVKGIFGDGRFVVDGTRCPNFVKEAKGWKKDPKTGKQIDKHNHCMSNFRYAAANIKRIRGKISTVASKPGVRPRATQPGVPYATRSSSGSGPVGLRERGTRQEDWRRSLGGPLPMSERMP